MFYYAQNVLFLVIPRRNDEGSQCRAEGTVTHFILSEAKDPPQDETIRDPSQARDDLRMARSLAPLRMTSALERGAVRVAIIGCGSMGLLGHLPACQAEGIEVVAAADPMPARLAMFRDAAGLTDADCATDPAEVLDP